MKKFKIELEEHKVNSRTFKAHATKYYMKKPKYKTGVVNNAPGLYWLNVTPVVSPPTTGYQMTRKGLRELKKQIEFVLAGNTGGGWAWTARGLRHCGKRV